MLAADVQFTICPCPSLRHARTRQRQAFFHDVASERLLWQNEAIALMGGLQKLLLDSHVFFMDGVTESRKSRNNLLLTKPPFLMVLEADDAWRAKLFTSHARLRKVLPVHG